MAFASFPFRIELRCLWPRGPSAVLPPRAGFAAESVASRIVGGAWLWPAREFGELRRSGGDDRGDGFLEKRARRVVGVRAEAARLEPGVQVIAVQRCVGRPHVNPDPPGAVVATGAQSGPVDHFGPQAAFLVLLRGDQPVYVHSRLAQVTGAGRFRPDRAVGFGRDRDGG